MPEQKRRKTMRPIDPKPLRDLLDDYFDEGQGEPAQRTLDAFIKRDQLARACEADILASQDDNPVLSDDAPPGSPLRILLLAHARVIRERDEARKGLQEIHDADLDVIAAERKNREEAEALADRLAYEALTALAAARIPTPEKDHREAPLDALIESGVEPGVASRYLNWVMRMPDQGTTGRGFSPLALRLMRAAFLDQFKVIYGHRDTRGTGGNLRIVDDPR